VFPLTRPRGPARGGARESAGRGTGSGNISPLPPHPRAQRADGTALASTSGTDNTGRPGSRGRGLPPLAAGAGGAPPSPPRLGKGAHSALRASAHAGALLQAVTADAFGTSLGESGMAGVRNPHVSGAALERALGQVLAALDPTAGGAPGALLHGLGLSSDALGQQGLGPAAAERLHRLLYVSTVGFSSSLSDILREAPARSPALMRAVVQGHGALAQAVLRRTFHSEVLALADLSSAQAAELLARLEELARAHADQGTLERALASVTAAHAEEVARNKALAEQLRGLEDSVEEIDGRYAVTMHQYVSEAHHRADLQAEVAELRAGIEAAEGARAAAEERAAEERGLREAAEEAGRGARARVPELEGALQVEAAARQAAEERLADLTETHQRSEWRQRVTHDRFREEMAGKSTLQERVLRAEAGLTQATRDLDALREAHRALVAEHAEAGSRLGDAESRARRLEYDREELAGAVKRLEQANVDLQEALDRKREKKRDYKRANGELASQLEASGEMLESLRGQVQELAGELRRAERESGRQRNDLRRATEQLRSTTVGFAHAMRFLRANQVARKHLQHRVAELAAQGAATGDRLARTQKKLEGAEGEGARLRAEGEGLRERVAALEADLSAAEGARARLEAELGDARGLLESGAAGALRLSGEVEALKAEALEAAGRLERTAGELEAERAGRRAAEARADGAERELTNTKAQLVVSRADVERLQGQLKDGRELIKGLEGRLAAEGARVREGLGREAGLGERVAGLEGDLAASRDETAGVRAELAERDGELAAERGARAEDVSRLSAEAAGLRADLDRQRAEMLALKSALELDNESKDAEIARLLGVVSGLQDTVADRDATVAELGRTVEGLKERIANMNAALEDLRGRLDEEAGRSNQLHEQKVWFQSQVESVLSANASLNDRHVLDEEEVGKLKAMLTEGNAAMRYAEAARDQLVGVHKKRLERQAAETGLAREERWLRQMTQAMMDLQAREEGYAAAAKQLKALEMSFEELPPLVEQLRGGDTGRALTRLEERMDVIASELGEAKVLRARHGGPDKSAHYDEVLMGAEKYVSDMRKELEKGS